MCFSKQHDKSWVEKCLLQLTLLHILSETAKSILFSAANTYKPGYQKSLFFSYFVLLSKTLKLICANSEQKTTWRDIIHRNVFLRDKDYIRDCEA